MSWDAFVNFAHFVDVSLPSKFPSSNRNAENGKHNLRIYADIVEVNLRILLLYGHFDR